MTRRPIANQLGDGVKARIIKPQDLDADHLLQWRSMNESADLYQSPFYSPHFTRAVAQTRSDAFVAILESEGQIVGFFPFHKLRNGAAKPIGGPISDYHGPILAPGFDSDPVDLLAACGLASYDFNHMPCSMEKFASQSYARSRSLQVDLPDGCDAYFADRPSSFTKVIRNMERRRRKLDKEIGPVRLVYHDLSNDAHDLHWEFKNQQFALLGLPPLSDTPWVLKSLDIIRHVQTPDFAGVMSTLYAGDRLMAAHFGMRTNAVLHWWFPSFDRDAKEYGPGLILLHDMVRRAPEDQWRILDFGRGEDAFKHSFANREVSLCEGSVERTTTLPGILRKGQKALLSAARPLPLGKYESYPRRALARLISGMRLPFADE